MTTATPVITGTAEECLKHFSETSVGILRARHCKVRNSICRLLKIGSSCGYKWFDKLVMPKGVNFHKLSCLLELLGYTLTDREGLSIVNRELANQIGLMTASVDEVSKVVGVSPPSVLRWCHGSEILPSFEGPLKAFLQLNKAKTEEAKDVWLTAIQKMRLIAVANHQSVPPSLPSKVSSTMPVVDRNDHGHIIEIMSHMILAMRPLTRIILSEEFSSVERDRLRELTTNGRSSGVFELSNLLHRLCGERARRDLQQ